MGELLNEFLDLLMPEGTGGHDDPTGSAVQCDGRLGQKSIDGGLECTRGLRRQLIDPRDRLLLFRLLVELLADGGNLLVLIGGGGGDQFHDGGVDGDVGIGDQRGKHGLCGRRVAVQERINAGRFICLLGLVELFQHSGNALVVSGGGRDDDGL